MEPWLKPKTNCRVIVLTVDIYIYIIYILSNVGFKTWIRNPLKNAARRDKMEQGVGTVDKGFRRFTSGPNVPTLTHANPCSRHGIIYIHRYTDKSESVDLYL